MTEINVTSPTGIHEVKRFGGADIAALIWDAIEKKTQMITVRKSDERGNDQDRLAGIRATAFPSATITIRRFESFGPLRVINEDWITGGAGFPPHPHRDMEIVTYILDGAIAHKDSTGGGGTIRPGEIQRMSAGSGIVHAEFNASADRDLPSAADLDHAVQDAASRPAMSRRRIDAGSGAQSFRPHRRARAARE